MTVYKFEDLKKGPITFGDFKKVVRKFADKHGIYEHDVIISSYDSNDDQAYINLGCFVPKN